MTSATATNSAGVLELTRRAQPVVDRFYDAVVACGQTPPFKPSIQISRSHEAIHYSHSRRAVVLTPYELLEPARREAMERFAKAGTLGLSGREQYVEIFNDLLVAHELGHWIQEIVERPLTRWEAEFGANRMMVAFWRDYPADAPAPSTQQRLANFIVQPQNMPSLLQEENGTPVEAYFNANIADIEAQPVRYAAFQKLMVRQAMSESPQPSFCQTIETARRMG